MIEPELARRFIEQVTQYTEYNINIMNEAGVIIASRDPKRPEESRDLPRGGGPYYTRDAGHGRDPG